MQEVRDALEVLTNEGAKKSNIVVLQCTTEYPTPMEDVNLRAMLTMENDLGVKVGYSDHTQGIEVPIAAVAMGATVIEKHFTLDRKMEGPDHSASLEPNELKQMVSSIRNVKIALGSGIKEPTLSEKKNIPTVRKSIVASKKILIGDVFTPENLGVKRPGSGISPMQWNETIGKISKKDFDPDELLTT
jgi:N,N'-diacetyllegionaminate synthase